MIQVNLTEVISAGVGVVATGVAWYAKNKGWLEKLLPWLKKPLAAADQVAQTVVSDAEHILQNGQAQIVIHNLQNALDAMTASGAQKSILSDVQILLSALQKSANTLTPTEIGWMVSYVRQKLPPTLQHYATTAAVVSAIHEAESTVSSVSSSPEFAALQEVVKYAGEANTAPVSASAKPAS